MATILLFAVLLGLIPAVIASKKGHSFIAWWIYGALLWIVAFPHSLFVKPDRGQLERSNQAAGLRKCAACKEWIQRDANLCRFCGSAVNPSIASASQESQQLLDAPPMPKGPSRGVKVLIVIGVAVVGILVVLFSMVHDISSASQPAATNASSSASPASTSPARTPSQLMTLSGTGSKSTKVVEVLDEWQMQWSYDCSNFGMQGNFQVFAYNSDGSISNLGMVNQLGTSGSDVDYYQPGWQVLLHGQLRMQMENSSYRIAEVTN